MARGREGNRESEVSLKLRKEGISKSRSGQKSQSISREKASSEIYWICRIPWFGYLTFDLGKIISDNEHNSGS